MNWVSNKIFSLRKSRFSLHQANLRQQQQIYQGVWINLPANNLKSNLLHFFVVVVDNLFYFGYWLN